MAIRKIKDKMLKSDALIKDKILQRHIPETLWYSGKTLEYMLQRYSVVFVKPNMGSMGSGIIRVTRLHSGQIELKSQKNRKEKVPANDMVKTLADWLERGKQYFVQQGIDLATLKGRPFDFRMIMHKPTHQWIMSGWVAKLAAPAQFVTNFAKGGKARAVEVILKESDHNLDTDAVCKELKDVSFRVASTLDHSFTDLRILGIDAGVDRAGKVWFIEANTRPTYRLFQQLDDESMYQRVMMTHRFIHERYKGAEVSRQITAAALTRMNRGGKRRKR